MIDKVKKINNSYRQIFVNFSYLSITQIVTILLPLITYPYLIRVLGKETYGLYAFANSLVAYFTILINFGFNISATKDVAQNKFDITKLSEIVSTVYLIKLILFLISFTIYIGLILSLSKTQNNLLFHIFTFAFCLGDLLIPAWFFQGIEKMKHSTLVHVISRVLFTVLIFIVVKDSSDLIYLPLFNLIGVLISGIYCSYIVFYEYNVKLKNISLNCLIYTVKDSFTFFVSRISAIFNTETNTVIIGLFFSMHEVAYYDLGKKIIDIALIPFSMLNNAVYPTAAREKNMVLMRKIIKVVLILSVIISICILLLSKYIIIILAGFKMLDSRTILTILCIQIPIYAVSYFLGNTVLVVNNYKKEFNLSVIFQTLVFSVITVVLLLLKIWNMYIGAFVLIISSLIMLLYRLYYIKLYKLL